MKIKRIAHRGFSSEAPENTQASFAMAVEGDFYGVECDIWKSKDGVYVVSHDGHLRRMCGIDRWIPQMNNQLSGDSGEKERGASLTAFDFFFAVFVHYGAE